MELDEGRKVIMGQMMQDLLCSVLAKGSEQQRALFGILSRSPCALWRMDLGEGRMGEAEAWRPTRRLLD